MSGAGDPLRTGAIFRVADASVLRQSAATRLAQPASASPLAAPPPLLQRPAPARPVAGFPPASLDPLLQLMARNLEVLTSAPIKRRRSPTPPPASPPPPPEPPMPKVRRSLCAE